MAMHGIHRLAKYYWYHKCVFGITNTKFDISYCVFRESFLRDQYNIKAFIDRIGSSRRIFFLDIGRNHGFVFYYAMYHVMKTGFQVSSVDYCGIDPSPLKFVYFNFHDYLSKHGIKINYTIIDRAVVFDQARKAVLKYGENNFGNFHVLGSNYSKPGEGRPSDRQYVEITVDTIQFSEILKLIDDNREADAVIVKIDCKNRTDYMFTEILDRLSARKIRYLVSCERDNSSDRDVSAYAKPGIGVLSAWNIGEGPTGTDL